MTPHVDIHQPPPIAWITTQRQLQIFTYLSIGAHIRVHFDTWKVLLGHINGANFSICKKQGAHLRAYFSTLGAF